MIIKQLQSTQFTVHENELEIIRDNIINKIKNGREDYYFSEKDYEKLLRYYFNKHDEESLKAMLSPTLIQALQASVMVFSEEENAKKLKNVQFKLLIEFVKNGDYLNTQLLLQFSPWCKSNINKELLLVEIGEMMPGASLLHLALKYGKVSIAKLLIDFGGNLHAIDCYDNSVMHYACMGGENSYQCILHFNLPSTMNIFGHIPEDYLRRQNELEIIKQRILINQFIKYIKLNHYDESIFIQGIKGNDLIKEINEGICDGESFIRALAILRGKTNYELYEKLRNTIQKWDGRMQSLDHSIEDAILLNEFSDLRNANLRALFEYMMSVILTSQQYPKIPLLDIKKGDKSAIFELLKNNDDKLDCFKESNETSLSREKITEELSVMLAHPDRLIRISLGNLSSSHAICIVTDKNNEIYFIDSNTPYKIGVLKNNTESINKIVKIMFSYFNQIKGMTTYEYSRNLSMKMKKK